ncbi:restriction endonuclease [uncultured Kordia sp.]|uniref:restriction endonuclease n=1 Tax=uncultured Kordia sp. TaxID=507699 RepID=UPI002639C6DB|nr:restriction endonuclease [uncultured Kordia sp.]
MTKDIVIIEDDLMMNHYIKENVLFSSFESKLNVASFTNYDEFIKNIDILNNNSIYILDYIIGGKNRGLDIYNIIKTKNKTAKIIFYSTFQLGSKVFQNMIPINDKDNIMFLSPMEGPEKLTQSIEVFTKLIYDENNNNKLLAVKNDIEIINSNLLEYLSRNPKSIYNINPRKFEELVAQLFKYEGYYVELTKASNDGGKDIYAYKKDFFNEQLFAVECKRFSENNKVGRPILQKLYGVVEHEKLTGGILVTSSFFTKPAKKFTKQLSNRIFLNDYYNLMELIAKHK